MGAAAAMKTAACFCLAVVAATACRGAGGPSAPPPPSPPLVISERGAEPRYAILIAEDAVESVRYAALELRDYVERLTGTRLPVVAGGLPPPDGTDAAVPSGGICVPPVRTPRSIFIRHVEDPALGEDGFLIRAVADGDLSVSGGRRGVLYGVYELLEAYCGVGWFASWRTVVPRLDRFEVPSTLDIRQKPAFPARTEGWLDEKRNGDFCARLRLNGQRCPLEARHGGFALRPGHGNGHTFGRYLPAKEFFKDHPEYFALYKGERNPGQPCLSNPDVLAIFKERVLDWIRKYPDGDLYMVTQNDNWVHCQCDECRAIEEEEGSPAGCVLRFVNAIAEDVEKEFPGKFLETYAYMWSQKAPKRMRPRRNVWIYLCNDGTQGPPYLDRHRTHEEQRGSPFSFARTLEDWRDVADNIHVYDYNTNFSRSLYAFPIELTFAPNLRLYRDCNVKYVNGFGGQYTLHSDFAELKLWLYAKLAWNPDQPVEPLLKRFFNGYYGAAAPMAREIFDILQREYAPENSGFLGMYQRDERLYPEGTLRRCRALWDEALAAVKGAPALECNVRMSALPVAWMLLETHPMPKRFFVSRNPSAFAYDDPEALSLVRQIRSAMEECPDIVLAENKIDRLPQIERMERIENPTEPGESGDMLPLEEKCFAQIAWSSRAKFEDDPEAGDGRAMRCFNNANGPAARLAMRDVAFDPGTAYRIRVRARIDRGEAREDAAAFSAYVRGKTGSPYGFDGEKRLRRTWLVGEVSEDDAWHELPAWVPSDGESLYLMRGSCDRWPDSPTAADAPAAVWFDCAEIVRAEAGAVEVP